MAKIILTIEADTPQELQSALAGLAGGDVPVNQPVNQPNSNYPGTLAPGDMNAPAAPRGRPRKPAAPATNASGDPATTGAGDDPGQTATTAADLLDGGTAAGGAVTKEMVAAKISEALAASGAMGAQAHLESKGLPNRLSLMTPEHYAPAIAALDELISMA